MADILTKSERSELMSKVRGAGNASTELRLVALFRAHSVIGWRRGATIRHAGRKSKGRMSQVDQRRFQVRPDFVFPKLKLAVFVDGCFWHGCSQHATQPKQNAEFWREKIERNKARDRLVTRTLKAKGWRVLRIWEHELKKKNERRLLTRFRRYGLI